MINGRCGSRRIILEQFGHRRVETFVILIWVLFEVGGLAGIPRRPSSGERRTLVGHSVGKETFRRHMSMPSPEKYRFYAYRDRMFSE